MEIRNKALSLLPVLEEAVKELYLTLNITNNAEEIPPFQVQFVSGEEAKSLRSLKSEEIGKVIKIEGIIIRAGQNLIKGKKIVLECRSCRHKKKILLDHGFSGVKLPSRCENSNSTNDKEKCISNPYIVVESESTFLDY